MHSFNGIARELIVKIHTHVSYFTDRNRVMVQTMRGELIVGRERSIRLFHWLALQKNGLFKRPEELLVRARFFDSLQVELCAGSDDELGFPAGADCGGEAHEIVAVLKRAPRVEITCQEELCVRAIEEIGWV